MKIVILGSGGMLGNDLVKVFQDSSHQVFAITKQQADITDIVALKKVLFAYKPDYVINAAAFTDVDGCEIVNHKKQYALLVNGKGVQNLAEACVDIGAVLVHYSTDYVFDGSVEDGYSETYPKLKPLNVYGVSKAMGESSIAKIQKWTGSNSFLKYYLIRTSWLFGENGNNFVKTMLNLGEKRKEISVINDQFGKPTYSYDLALRTKQIMEWRKNFGIYHITNEGICTWYDFAKEIFKQKGINSVNVKPIGSAQYPSQVVRPKYSVLNNNKLPLMRNWQEALADYLK